MIATLPVKLDHIGVYGTDVFTLCRQYQSLGFDVIGPVELMAQHNGEQAESMGQQSAHIMFADTYIELTSVSKHDPEHHLAHFYGKPGGLRLLLFATPDTSLAHQQCVAAGLDASPVQEASRTVANSPAEEARFRWFALSNSHFSDVLVCYVQHLTPDTIFQKSNKHPNGAHKLCGVYLRYSPDSEIAKKFKAFADSSGEGWLRFGKERDLSSSLGTSLPADSLALVGFAVAVNSLQQTSRWLRENNVDHLHTAAGLLIEPASAGGCCVIFMETAQ